MADALSRTLALVNMMKLLSQEEELFIKFLRKEITVAKSIARASCLFSMIANHML